MEPGTKFCPDHPEVRVPEYADRCMQCNKPLQVHVAGAKTPDGPGPVVVEELENTIHDPRIAGLDYPPPIEKELVLKRLAELDEPDPAQALAASKETFKALHETITAKIKEKVESKHYAKKAHK
jgi:hypothetical protein